MKINELLKTLNDDLGAAEAAQVLCYLTGKDRAFFIAHGGEDVGRLGDEPEILARAEAICAARKAGRPLQYILGETEFMGLRIAVNESVLIPRPETELLCEEAKKILMLAARCGDCDGKCTTCLPAATGPVRILDICTGSGCIAAYLKSEFPDAEVFASDISEAALAVAAKNAPDVAMIHSDLFANIDGSFDLITANPPYIPRAALKDLQREVQEEPMLALDGGPSGFELPKKLIQESINCIKPNGTLLVEIGDDQGAEALETAANAGYRSCRIIKDYAGQDRILVAGF